MRRATTTLGHLYGSPRSSGPVTSYGRAVASDCRGLRVGFYHRALRGAAGSTVSGAGPQTSCTSSAVAGAAVHRHARLPETSRLSPASVLPRMLAPRLVAARVAGAWSPSEAAHRVRHQDRPVARSAARACRRAVGRRELGGFASASRTARRGSASRSREEEVVDREPHGAAPVGVPAEEARVGLRGRIVDLVPLPAEREDVRFWSRCTSESERMPCGERNLCSSSMWRSTRSSRSRDGSARRRWP